MSTDNSEQRDFWTDDAGPAWVAEAAAMDATLAPVLAAVLDAADLQPGERVLDIGCGTGTSTAKAASAVGPDGQAVGLDISRTLLDVAKERHPAASFMLADAQTHGFDGSFDAVISRFGVMFFEDFHAAFDNMARALRPGGRMALATWAAIPDNPFFTLPAAVAKAVLGPVPKSDPDAPGPFALRDAARIQGLLEGAGMRDIRIREVPLALSPAGAARDVARMMCRIGPAHRAITHHAASEAARAGLVDALAEALEAHNTADGIRIPALINICEARRP